jgi:hypothetical protein
MPQDQRSRYGDLIAAVLERAQGLERSGIDPAEVARVVADALEAGKPHARYLVGRYAKLRARTARLLPDRVFDRLIARNLGLGEAGASNPAGPQAEETSRLTSQ